MKSFKKFNPNQDRNLRFQIAIALVLAFCNYSFRYSWTETEVKHGGDVIVDEGIKDERFIHISPPLPQERKKAQSDAKSVAVTVETFDPIVLDNLKSSIEEIEPVDLDGIKIGTKEVAIKEARLTMPDRAASFPGGLDKIPEFLKEYLEYPEEAVEIEEFCTVAIRIEIDEHGNIASYNIVDISNPGYGFEDKAIDALKKMPKWEPAVRNNQYVKSWVTVPFVFEIY